MIKKFVNAKDFSCNVYVYSKDNKVLLIDPGFYNKRIKKYILECGELIGILLTHGHVDHILGLNDLVDDFDVPVYCLESELKLLRNPHYNGSIQLFKNAFCYNGEVSILNEGQYTIDNFTFEVINVKGHTIGSVIYYFKDDNAMFVGDFLIENSIGRCDLATGSEVDMNESLVKFKSLNFPLNTIIYSGHGEANNLSYVLDNNIFLK